MTKSIFAIFLLLCAPAFGSSWNDGPALGPDQAFTIGLGKVTPTQVEVRLGAADGFYLYADRLTFEPDTPDVVIAKVSMPAGRTKFDEAFGKVVKYYRGQVSVFLTLSGPANRFKLKVRAQGCADVGICYPPVSTAFVIARSAS